MTAVDEATARLGSFSTATVSDALDRLGLPTQVAGLRAFTSPHRLVGRASTLRYAPVGRSGGTVGDFIDDMPPGAVVAIDNRGREDVTVWGDLLSTVACHRGIAGTVIDGTFRDVDAIDALHYPIYARSAWMRTGKDRVALVERDGPITLGGVVVAPGDLLLGDRSGLVVVPRADEARVLDVAAEVEVAEQRIRDAVLAGARLDDARRTNGYHLLQRRGDHIGTDEEN